MVLTLKIPQTMRFSLLLSSLLFSFFVNAQTRLAWQDTTSISHHKSNVFTNFDKKEPWEGRAVSQKSIVSGQSGYADTYILTYKGEKVFGFTEMPNDTNWKTIAYGFHFDAKGMVSIIESGKIVKALNIKSDRKKVYRVWRIKNTVNYHIGKEKVYTSIVTSNKALHVQIAFEGKKGLFSRLKVSKSWKKSASNESNTDAVASLTAGEILMKVSKHPDKVTLNGLNENTLEAINALEDKTKYRYYVSGKNPQKTFNQLCEFMPWITSIQMRSPKDIKNMKGMLKLTSLENVYFDGSMSSEFPFDIALLKNASNLKLIQSFKFQTFSNLELLKDFAAFEYLELGNAELKSIAFLKGMNSLKTLNISGYYNSFTDFSPIASLSQLEHLTLNSLENANDIQWESFEALTQLKSFEMNHTSGISTLGFLANANALKSFKGLSNYGLKNTKGLSNKPQLEHVGFFLCQDITDIGFAATTPKLKELNLNGTAVTSLTPLSSCNELEVLDASGTKIKTIEPLNGLVYLRSLDVSKTQVRSFSSIYKAKKMGFIGMDEAVSDKEAKALKKRYPYMNSNRRIELDE